MTLNGREIVTFTAEEVDRRAEAFGRGFNWYYAMPEVTNVRPTGGDDGVKSFISFDHRGKTIRFGTGPQRDRGRARGRGRLAPVPELMPRVERVRREEAAGLSRLDRRRRPPRAPGSASGSARTRRRR